MKNNTNLKKLGALLLTGALMTGAIVGTNAITAKAAESGASNTFLLDVPAEINASPNKAGGMLGIFTTSAMPEEKQITLSATTTNTFNLRKANQTVGEIPYGLVGQTFRGNKTVVFNEESLTIDGTDMENIVDDNVIDGISYAYRDIIFIGAFVDQEDVDSAGEGDYEDEITFIAEMVDKLQN